MKDELIGFIGQGWIGKHYADDFENRGYKVVRYALEEPYLQNGEKIKQCDIVFIAVPTPSSPEGFDDSIIRQAVKKAGKGKTVVIKSTILPGTTESIQEDNPDIFVFHSPEFLTEATAAYEAANPVRNIIGAPKDNDDYQARAETVMGVLPPAGYCLICKSREAELIKYGGNNWFYFKVIFTNLLYDMAMEHGADWKVIRDSLVADPRIGSSHLNPVHNSGEKDNNGRRNLEFNELHVEPVHKSGRGAGGHCFIKDFAAFSEEYKRVVGDEAGVKLLEAMRDKNIDLLLSSEKDLDLLAGVYGKKALDKRF